MSTLSDILSSIRDQIPDQTCLAFSDATLLRWVNDAGRSIASRARVIFDWYAVPSVSGMDIYELPSHIMTVEQTWYDLLPLTRSTEMDDIFRTKVSGPSWWFGPHSTHAVPRLHVWPCPSRTAANTVLTDTISSTATAIPIADSEGFMAYGFLRIEDEVILYRNIPVSGAAGSVTNILRGQGGTIAAIHNAGAHVQELNIFFKCTRLPAKLLTINDPIEIPEALWPVIELYVLAKVRSAEQNEEVAVGLRREFTGLVDQLAAKNPLASPRQGIQVREADMGTRLYGGRTYIP